MILEILESIIKIGIISLFIIIVTIMVISIIKKYGFKTLIIWSFELKNPSKVIDKIREL